MFWPKPRPPRSTTGSRQEAIGVEYVVLGGGNAKNIKKLPPDTRLGDNRNAFVGGFRLWERKTKPRRG